MTDGNRSATTGFRKAPLRSGVRLSTIAIAVGLVMAVLLIPIPGASILGLLIVAAGLAWRFLVE